MGLIWAAGWSCIGFIIGFLLLLVSGPAAAVIAVLNYALSGFVAGAAFSVVLRIAEGRRTFDQMSLPRFAVLGGGTVLAFQLLVFALAAALGNLPFSAFQMGFTATVATLIGAGSAAGSLALARRADDPVLEPDEGAGLLGE